MHVILYNPYPEIEKPDFPATFPARPPPGIVGLGEGLPILRLVSKEHHGTEHKNISS